MWGWLSPSSLPSSPPWIQKEIQATLRYDLFIFCFRLHFGVTVCFLTNINCLFVRLCLGLRNPGGLRQLTVMAVTCVWIFKLVNCATSSISACPHYGITMKVQRRKLMIPNRSDISRDATQL
jgi:hypothetical protein